MKFMLIMQSGLAGCEAMASWAPAELEAHFDHMAKRTEGLAARGELVTADGLESPRNTKVITAKKSDAPVVFDGPFAETKEFLAGFWIVEVASADRTVEIAARISAAPGKGGAPAAIPIEVRQVMSAPVPDP